MSTLLSCLNWKMVCYDFYMSNSKSEAKHTDTAIAQPPTRGVVKVYRTKKELMVANLLGGLAWGAGSVLGAALFVAFALAVLNFLGGLPVIGSYITDIAESISSGVGR